jgi:hypothetical protein
VLTGVINLRPFCQKNSYPEFAFFLQTCDSRSPGKGAVNRFLRPNHHRLPSSSRMQNGATTPSIATFVLMAASTPTFMAQISITRISLMILSIIHERKLALSIKTIRTMTLNIMTIRIIALSIAALRITLLRIMTQKSYVTRHNKTRHNDLYYYDGQHNDTQHSDTRQYDTVLQ